jgi:hypothetical protein
MSDEDIIKFLASNPKHASANKALTPEQVTAVISHIRGLEKK